MHPSLNLPRPSRSNAHRLRQLSMRTRAALPSQRTLSGVAVAAASQRLIASIMARNRQSASPHASVRSNNASEHQRVKALLRRLPRSRLSARCIALASSAAVQIATKPVSSMLAMPAACARKSRACVVRRPMCHRPQRWNASARCDHVTSVMSDHGGSRCSRPAVRPTGRRTGRWRHLRSAPAAACVARNHSRLEVSELRKRAPSSSSPKPRLTAARSAFARETSCISEVQWRSSTTACQARHAGGSRLARGSKTIFACRRVAAVLCSARPHQRRSACTSGSVSLRSMLARRAATSPIQSLHT